MRTFMGIALGFAMMPAVLGLIGGFVALSMWLDLRKVDELIGVVLGCATFVIGVAVAIKMFPPS